MRWQEAAEVLHARKHGKDSIDIGLTLAQSPIDAMHPGFQDPKSGDIYRFDVQAGHIAVTTPTGDMKTCYRTKQADFRRAALVSARNRSSMSYEELGAVSSDRKRDARRHYTLRDDIFDDAIRAGLVP